MSDVARERLHWTFEIDGDRHTIDLLPTLLTGSVNVDLDGRRVTRLSKPRPQDPWRERALVVGGRAVLVAVIWAAVMQTDVFIDGRSVLDGRSIDERRRDAPEAVHGYELWFGRFVGGGVLPTTLEVAYLAAIAGVFGLITVAALWVRGVEPPRVALGGILYAAALFLILMGVQLWFGLTGEVNRRLLARPDLGDARRVALISIAFIGLPVALLLAVGIVVAAIGRPLSG